MLALVLNCIDRLNIYNSIAHFAGIAREESGMAWMKCLPSIQSNKEVTLYLHKSPWLAGWLLPFQEVKGKLFPFDGHWAGRKRLFPPDPLSGSLRELVWQFVQYFLSVLPTCHKLEERLQSQKGPDWPGISFLQRP